MGMLSIPIRPGVFPVRNPDFARDDAPPGESESGLPSIGLLRPEGEAMCDEYDDERMRLFWRALAEKESLPVIDEERIIDPERPLQPIATGTDAHLKPKARPLTR